MFKLDERDIKILSILQQEGRITKTALAERVNLSPTPCWDRLKRLEREGIIEGYGARVNLASLGVQTTILVAAQIDSHKAQSFARFEAAVRKWDEVQECWAVGGEIDYLLKVVVPTINDYQKFVDVLLSEEAGLKRYTSYIVKKQVKYPRAISDSVLGTLKGR